MIDYEKAFKKLLALNYLGVHLEMAVGHWWIECNREDSFQKILRNNGIALNNKIYGGPLEAIATCEQALRMADGTLLCDVYTSNWHMGSPRFDGSRIERRDDGTGGLV